MNYEHKPVMWARTFRGMRVIEDRFAYKEEIKFKIHAVGIPDKRRPNNKKMLYRKVTERIVKRTPLAFRVKAKEGDFLLVHPDIMRAVEKHMRASIAAYTQAMLFQSFYDPASKDGDKSATMPRSAEWSIETKLTEEQVDSWKKLLGLT